VQEYVYYPQSFEPLALTGYGRRWSEKDGFSEPEKRTYFYHNDVNGAPMRLTDERGGVVWSQSAGPWGAWSEQTGSVRNPLRFQGQYFDEESGLHYNRYRYYEPESGRYISADPLKLGAGLNTYAYAPNPLGWIDPLGLDCIPNKVAGDNREAKLLKRLQSIFGKGNVLSQRHLRNAQGKMVGLVDDVVQEGRKGSRILDFVVKTKDGWKGIEVTSKTASKVAQSAKEEIIRASGGGFVRHPVTKELIELSDDISRIIRLD
ncbi:type IV secretion protein Rhs, partial [Salmonella enterica]|nr:type IV secretion protein Rhs [Salmonella enterica]